MAGGQCFVMTLSNNDVSGQRGEGYMLIPIAARTKRTGFWGWSGQYEQNGAHVERKVTVIDGGVQRQQRIYYQDTKREFRLGTELYFSGASADAILLVERDPAPGVDFAYSLLEPSDPRYQDIKSKAKDWATAGNKRFGYFQA